MRKLGISITEIEAVEQALAAANGKARRYTARAEKLVTWASQVEEQLAGHGLPISERIGTDLHVHTAGPGARRRGYEVVGSYVHLRRAWNGWRLVESYRVRRFTGQRERLNIAVSAEAMSLMQCKLRSKYSVK
jgi:hypothetical protein